MAMITLDLHFECDGMSCIKTHEFDVCEGMISDIEEYINEILSEGRDDWDFVRGSSKSEDSEWEYTDCDIVEYDDEFPDPSIFLTLDDYARVVEAIEEHGEAYRLRWEDIDEFDNFDDSYCGCWSSEEEYAQNFYEGCYGSDNTLFPYVDWESYARDLLMDFSVYEGDDGYHIFRD